MWCSIWSIIECWNHKFQRAYITDRTMWFLQHSAYILCVSDCIVLWSICNCLSNGKAYFFTYLLCASTILFIAYLIFYASSFITVFIWTQLGSICKWLLLYRCCMVPRPSRSVGWWVAACVCVRARVHAQKISASAFGTCSKRPVKCVDAGCPVCSLRGQNIPLNW
jgi:hypothetical protein